MDESVRRLLAVARGDEPADLLLAGGTLVDVLSGELRRADVAVVGDRIAAVGPAREARETVDAGGRFLMPGLIDAHVHLESSLVTPLEFARAVVPRGTTTVICDPHEIANVAGMDGVRWILDASEDLPLTVLVNAPSCVPASHLAGSGAALDAAELTELGRHPRVLGLAEVMNVPGAVLGDETLWAKIDAFRGRPLDGHAPGVSGGWLQAYAAAGILTDHECTSVDEAREKLRLGINILLREGTAARNLLDLLPILSLRTIDRCALCTDDRHPQDLVVRGHIDHLVRLAVGAGLEPLDAVRLATRSPAGIYGLPDRGAIAPGRVADLVVCDDLRELRPAAVYARGRLAARAGEPAGAWPEAAESPRLGALTVNTDRLDLEIRGPDRPVRVIDATPGQLVTACAARQMPWRDGLLVPDPEARVAKLAVIERHRGSGNIGLGFVRGLDLSRGAIGGTVAHDHHNLVVAGMDDESMATVVRALAAAGGGLAAAVGTRVLALLPLPVGGLMTDRPLAEVCQELGHLFAAARELGSSLEDPFMLLSFLALEVIPELKLTDRGLVDVTRFEIVPLYA
ncbi:MAG: adenine deaminase [Acidobacteria bacterium]|nr:adenine deaminase [Acidobacteriota bacterium]